MEMAHLCFVEMISSLEVSKSDQILSYNHYDGNGTSVFCGGRSVHTLQIRMNINILHCLGKTILCVQTLYSGVIRRWKSSLTLSWWLQSTVSSKLTQIWPIY